MKTITIKKRSKVMDDVLAMAKGEDVIVQTPEGDEFLVAAIDDFDREIACQRANKELMAFLDKRFRDGRRNKGIPLEEVTKRLDLKSTAKGRARAAPRK